jgi:MFS transporter, OFA family, oxalate/formate antiporter
MSFNEENSVLMKKRWLIAAAGVIVQLCLGTVYAWSIFKKPMMAAHGWSETTTQAAFMIQSLCFSISVALGGILIDRKGPRLTGLIGGTLFGSGLLLAAYANLIGSPWLLYIAYGMIVGLGGGLGYTVPITTLIRWFPDKRGLVTGLAVMGYGFGSFIMGNLAPRAILDVGLEKTFVAWGLLSIILVPTGIMLIKNPPPGWMSQYSPSGKTHMLADSNSFTFGEAVRTWQYWALWLMLFLNVTAGLGLISQLSPIAQDIIRQGLSGNLTEERLKGIYILSGTIVAVASIFNGMGRFIWAWLSDLAGRRAVFVIIFLTEALGYGFIGHSTGSFMFACFACYLLACYGGMFATFPAFVADMFGPANIGKIYGVIFTAVGLAGVTGPYLFARVKMITGSFQTALYIESVILVAGLLLIAVFRRPMRKYLTE